MGKIVEKKRKKKKGRPSLLDLQKRSLKQQQEQQNHLKKQQQFNNKPVNPKFQNPNPTSSSIVRRSTRRNPNPNSDQDEEHSAGKRREKELKHVLKLPNKDNDEVNSDNSGSDSDHSLGSNHKKRKIDSISHGSGAELGNKSEKHSADATKQTNTQSGSMLDDGPSTSLPDKSLLLFILDRLQKKDTYGVFAEPVDPEELPDYHEVIQNPMDFSTLRKKLENGAYANLEQFEKDVFLICSNAMQYNAPETVYFRQARTIQELAQRSFDNLRANSDNEPEHEPKVVRRGRPPTKNLKRPPGRPPLERANSDFSEPTIASSGGTTNRSNNDLRKASHLEKIGSTDSFARSLYGARISEAYVGWSAERYERADDFIGSGSKGVAMKHGKKHIVLDDSRRSTYMHSCALSCGQDSSVFTTFNRERKQLIAMGLHTEYGYARSLARFAAKIGPVAWKVASKKIERCLPAGVKFGPGWVGENDAPAERSIQQQSTASAGQQTPSSSLSAPTDTASAPAPAPAPAQRTIDSSGNKSSLKPQVDQLSETEEPCIKSEVNEEPCKVNSPSAAANIANPVSSSNLPSNGAGSGPNSIAPETTASSPSNSMVNVLNNGTSSVKPGNPHQIHQKSTVHPRINGLNGSYGHNFAAQMGKMIGTGRPSVLQSNPSIVSVSKTETQSLQPPTSYSNGCEEAISGNTSTKKPVKNLPSTVSNQNVESTAPDLNVGFQSSGSPVSGKTDAVQPDLALQL